MEGSQEWPPPSLWVDKGFQKWQNLAEFWELCQYACYCRETALWRSTTTTFLRKVWCILSSQHLTCPLKLCEFLQLMLTHLGYRKAAGKILNSFSCWKTHTESKVRRRRQCNAPVVGRILDTSDWSSWGTHAGRSQRLSTLRKLKERGEKVTTNSSETRHQPVIPLSRISGKGRAHHLLGGRDEWMQPSMGRRTNIKKQDCHLTGHAEKARCHGDTLVLIWRRCLQAWKEQRCSLPLPLHQGRRDNNHCKHGPLQILQHFLWPCISLLRCTENDVWHPQRRSIWMMSLSMATVLLYMTETVAHSLAELPCSYRLSVLAALDQNSHPHSST